MLAINSSTQCFFGGVETCRLGLIFSEGGRRDTEGAQTERERERERKRERERERAVRLQMRLISSRGRPREVLSLCVFV